jgi:hypothetical protein
MTQARAWMIRKGRHLCRIYFYHYCDYIIVAVLSRENNWDVPARLFMLNNEMQASLSPGTTLAAAARKVDYHLAGKHSKYIKIYLINLSVSCCNLLHVIRLSNTDCTARHFAACVCVLRGRGVSRGVLSLYFIKWIIGSILNLIRREWQMTVLLFGGKEVNSAFWRWPSDN